MIALKNKTTLPHTKYNDAGADPTLGGSVVATSVGKITTTQWLVGDSAVATGLTPTLALSNGATVITFKATDNDGNSSTTTVTITVATPTYTVTDEWPSPYNGVTPDSSLGLAFNNIGVFSASDSIIYTCLRIFTDGLPGSAGGISEFDIGLTVVSLDEATVQITKYREFNTIGALNENVELPDCSGKFETTTSVYTDILEAWLRQQAGSETYQESFIQYWLQEILFYQAPLWVFAVAYTTFALLVLMAWLKFPPSFFSRDDRSSTSSSK